MKKFLMICMIVMALAGCTDPEGATKVLKYQGFSNIQITGYDFWGRAKDDWYSTGFRATTVDGTLISGTVTSGLFFKGSTIRYDD